MFDGGGGKAMSLVVEHIGYNRVFYGIPFECAEAMAREGKESQMDCVDKVFVFTPTGRVARHEVGKRCVTSIRVFDSGNGEAKAVSVETSACDFTYYGLPFVSKRLKSR